MAATRGFCAAALFWSLCFFLTAPGASFPLHAQDDDLLVPGEMNLLGDDLPSAGTFSEDDLGLKSKKEADVLIRTEKGKNALGVSFRLENKAPLTFEIETDGGKKKKIEMRVADQTWEVERSWEERTRLRKKGILTEGADKYSGWLIRFSGLDIDYYMKPNFKRYRNNMVNRFIPEWERLFPEYWERNFRLDVIPDGRNCQIWLDGRYAGMIPGAKEVKSMRITGGMGPVIQAEAYASDPASDFLTLEFPDTIYAPDVLKKGGAALSLKPGRHLIGKIPLNVLPPERSLEPARHRNMRGLYDLVMDPYTSRTAFDSMPESMLYSVPGILYARAYVLCALDPDEQKNADLTVRLTRFGGNTRGRGGAISDNTIDLRKDRSLLTEAGTLEWTAKNGKKNKTPLYLAEIPIDCGSVMDLLSIRKDWQALKIGPYFDLEFLASPESGVWIFGATLEKNQWDMRLHPSRPGNIFHNDEKPETALGFFSRKADEKGKLVYTISDAWDKEISRKEIPLSSKTPFTEKLLTLPLAMDTPGWYALKLEVFDSSGRLELKHNAAFALLPPDTREAGYESPFGVWVFAGEHNTESDPDVIGELCLKAGFRKTTVVADEARMKPWKTTLNQILNYRGFNPDSPDSPDKFRKYLKDMLKRFPSCSAIDIFHEYGGIGIPKELLGMKQPEILESDPLKSKDARIRGAAMMAKIVRDEFPELKILYGNSCASSELLAWGLSQGLTDKHMDYVGIETPAYGGLPERPDILKVPATWAALQTARKYGYKLPASGCFEFTYRSERRYQPKIDHARHYMRDILQGLAFGFRHVTPGILDDVCAAYYHGNWGGSGYLERHPLLYPKRAYVAAATLTRVLDKAEFKRRPPTGSLSVYALEFERLRKTKDFAYAFWTPRFEADLTVRFPKGTRLELTEMFGSSRELDLSGDGSVTFRVGPSPVYLTASSALLDPVHSRYLSAPPPGKVQALPDCLSDPASLKQFRDYSLYQIGGMPSRIPGTFELRAVEDPERGKVIEAELKGRENLPEIVNEYAVFRFKDPVPVESGDGLRGFGMWVKGNSSFGSVLFEFTDAKGRIWRSELSDNALITFDSWQFMGVSLDPSLDLLPRAAVKAGSSAKTPDFPIRITGFLLETAQHALNPCEMQKTDPKLRVSGLSLLY